jgi:hypothetical protein
VKGIPKAEPKFVGVAQGAPTSPLLAISILDPFIAQAPCIIYADDPIFYSNHRFTIKDNPTDGIVINQDKTS